MFCIETWYYFFNLDFSSEIVNYYLAVMVNIIVVTYTVVVFLELGAESVPLAALTSLPLLLVFSKPVKRAKLIVKSRKSRFFFSVWPQRKKAQRSSVSQFHQCGS